MITLAAITLGLALLAILDGSLEGLRHLSVPLEGTAIVLFLVQGLFRGRLPYLREWSAPVLIWAACSLVLVGILWLNRSRPPLGLIALGIASNVTVVLLNGGMPVATSRQLDDLGDFYHRLNVADVAVLLADNLPVPGGLILSLGDVLMLVGVTIFIASAGVGHCTTNTGVRQSM